MKLKPVSIALGLGLVAAALLVPETFATPRAPDQFQDLSTDDALLAKALTWGTCTPNRVATFENRVHIQCTAPISGILYFAAPTSDPAYAGRVLSVLTAALAMGRDVEILYDPTDTTGAAFGCQASDCRRIRGVSVLP